MQQLLTFEQKNLLQYGLLAFYSVIMTVSD